MIHENHDYMQFDRYSYLEEVVKPVMQNQVL